MSHQMPNQTFEPMPPLPPLPPQNAVPKKTPFWKRMWFLPVFALIFGLAAGSASASAKEVEVIKEVPVEKIVTKEVKTNVPTTPASCIEYIDLSEQAFDYSSEAMGYMGDALTAAGNFDVSGLDAATQRIKSVQPKLEAITPDVKRTKAECRAS